MSQRAPRWGLAWALLLGALITLPLLGARDLWAPDEPRYAEVSQEMLSDGHWWYPHVNARPYPDKPPLFFWLGAAAGAVDGRVDEADARLPSAVAHLLLIALVFHLGRRLFDERAAVVAALAMATLWLQAWMARRACLDVLLSFWSTAAVVTMVEAGLAARAGRPRRALAWAAAGGACTGLGIMTKGPVVLLAVGAAGLALLLHPEARKERPPGTLRALAVAALALGLVLVAWLVPAAVIGGYTPLAIAKAQVVDRATEGLHHEQPPWYFLGSVPADFMPWTLLAIPALVAAWRQRAQARHALLLSWVFAPLLIHSIIVEKRNIYLLPIAPAWALACGAWVASMEAASRGLRRAAALGAGLLTVLGAVTVTLGGGALAVPSRIAAIHGELGEALAIPGVPRSIAALGVVALLGAALLVATLRRHSSPLRLAAVLAVAFGAVELGLFATLPLLDPLKSGRTMGHAVRREVRDGPLGMYPRTWDAYVYYSGRSMADLGEGDGPRRWLASVARPAHVLVYEAQRNDLPLDGDVPPRVVFSDRVGSRIVLLVRYDRPPESVP